MHEIEFEILDAISRGTDPETGELTAECLAQIEELEMEKSKKQEAIALYCLNLASDVAQIDAEIDRLKALKQTKANKRERLMEFLQMSLNGAKMETPIFKIGYRKTTSVNLSDTFVTSNLGAHPELFRQKVDYSPDKCAIKAYLEAGNELDGASIEHNVRMSIT